MVGYLGGNHMGKIQTAVFASALVATAALTPAPIRAHKIYPLQGNQWAIICDDGTGYSFSGSEQGATDVAGLLCAGGFTVSPSGASPNIVGVTRGELLNADQVVVKSGDGRVSLKAGFCPAASPSGAREALDAFVHPKATKGGASGGGSAAMAIDEAGMPVDKKTKGKAIVTAGQGKDAGQAATRTGDCTLPPARPARPGSTG
jgi:hypothetical protein